MLVRQLQIEKLREYAKEAREHADRETDPIDNALLHRVAIDLEAAANEIERIGERK